MISSIGNSASTLALRTQMSAASSRPAPPEPQEMFKTLDTDGDGKVTLVEMQAMSEQHSAEGRGGPEPPAPGDMLAELDSDGDGALSFAEFEAGRPPEPPSGPPPGRLNSASVDLKALFGNGEDEQETSLLALLA